MLAACGVILGAAIAQPLSRALVRSLDTSENTVHLAIAPDWRVLLFAAAAGIATCVIFATLPALRSTGEDPLTSLKSGERGLVGNRERFSLQRAMVITQIAVSMVLLVGALLFVRSYRNLLTLNPGFRENRITIGYFGIPFAVKIENLADYKKQLVDAVRAIPGVENAAATTNVALSGAVWEHDVEVGTVAGSSKFTYVSPTFFATMGIPLLEGRNFTEYDTNDRPLVVIVNQAFVRKYVSGPSPLGVKSTYTLNRTIPRASIRYWRWFRIRNMRSARGPAAPGICAHCSDSGHGAGSCFGDIDCFARSCCRAVGRAAHPGH